MEKDRVKVLGMWSSPFVYRVIWALELKGIKYEYIEEENIYAQKSDLLLKYNPVHQKVPVLVHGGKPILESMIILEYLEETWPEKYPLLSKDPFQKSVSRFWSKFIDDQGPTFWKFFSTTGEEHEKVIKDILQILRTIEEHTDINKQIFFGGDMIGLADLAFGWMAFWLQVMEEVVEVKLIEIGSFPHLHAWRENFRKVLVIKENIYDHDLMLVHFIRTHEEDVF